MDMLPIMAKIASVRGYIGAGLAITAAVVATTGLLRVPAKQDAIAAAIEGHQVQADHTNAKLDVLICLQAKLDTPIRCVAREHAQ